MDWETFFESVFSYKTLGLGFLAVLTTKLIQDIAWYRFNLPTRNQTTTTKNCYDWFEHYLPNIKNKLIDYSEGIFDFTQDSAMDLQKATLNKYQYIFEKLDLKPGMRLLDAGCGNGVWMDYCRSRGVIVKGLTLSPEQADVVREKGLDVEVQDYRLENPEFFGQFDRITALGSTEHICSSMGALADGAARERSIETLAEVWNLLRRYLKSDGRIFITSLTLNEKATWSVMDYFQAYVLDQHYGGYYPLMNDIQTKIAPKAGLTITDVEDHTASYHWSSMIEPKHFGYFTINWKENTWDKIAYVFKSAIKSPFQFPFHWLYQGLDTWMWQLGGPQNKPLSIAEVAKAPAQLKYFMMAPMENSAPELTKIPPVKKQIGIALNGLFKQNLSPNLSALKKEESEKSMVEVPFGIR